MPGCLPTEDSILAVPVEAPTDDIRAEPYGAETPDDQAPGQEEEPQEAPNDQNEQRSHVGPLSTSRVTTMRWVRSPPVQASFSRAVLTAPALANMAKTSITWMRKLLDLTSRKYSIPCSV
jgi:hypothetical protein